MHYPNTNNFSPEAQKHYGEAALKADALVKFSDFMVKGIIGLRPTITNREIDDAFDCRLENIKGNIEQAKSLGQISEQDKNRLFNENEAFSEALKDFLKSHLKLV